MRDCLCPFSLAIAALAVAAIGAASCGSDKSPTRPSASGEPGLVRLEMIGPSTIAPGGTAQYSIRGTWSDGRTGDVTNGVTWRSTNTAVVSIDASGKAVGAERGDSNITAAVDTLSVGKSVLVLPDGTFRVSGRVSDTTVAGIPIESAVVEADSSPDRITALTNARGEFFLYGVRRDGVLRVRKDGYTTHEQTLGLANHAVVDVALQLTGPRPLIAGTYVLSIGSPQCEGASPLPPLAEELRQRRYTAVLTQNNARVDVTLSGTGFGMNTFSGFVTATGANFDLSQFDYYYRTTWHVVERLSNGSFLVISGHAATTLTDSGLAGQLNGALVNQQQSTSGTILGRCVSSNLGFMLSRTDSQ